jgi:hypothetical protein
MVGLGPEKDYLARTTSIKKNRLVLSSERAPHKNNTVTVRIIINI